MSRNLQFFFTLFREFVLFFICKLYYVTFDLFVEDQSVVACFQQAEFFSYISFRYPRILYDWDIDLSTREKITN